jgi:Glycosyltransferase Family 4
MSAQNAELFRLALSALVKSSLPREKYLSCVARIERLYLLRRNHQQPSGREAAARGLRKMHVAQIAPLTEAIPPKLYGGTERVIHWLTEELVALGHDVTLFASGDSCTSARLEALWPRALRLDGAVRDPNALHMLMLERVLQRADEFDFLHFHLDYYPFSLFSRQPVGFVTTLHGRSICDTSLFSRLSHRLPSSRFPMPSAGRYRMQAGCGRFIMVCRSSC